MSEQSTPVSGGNTTSGAHGGTLLRQARERAGLHVATLAATLKVPVHRLEALEQGRFDTLPDATFTRALALSVCRVLKIDAAPVLAGLPAGQAPDLGPARDTIGAPMPRESGGTGGSVPSVRERARWWVALVLVVLAGVLWWVLPDADAPPPAEVGGVAVVPPVSDGSAAAKVPAGESASPVSPATPLSTSSAPVASTAAGPGDTATAPTAAAHTAAAPASVSTPTTAEARAPSPPPAATARVLELRIRGGASWIQVTGASGRVWLQRNVQPGETLRFDEDLPLAVTVGRADVTEVVVRGQPFDLAPIARNNVARFEIR